MRGDAHQEKIDPLECPRCELSRSIEVKLKGLRRFRSPAMYMGMLGDAGTTEVELDGRECLVCGEQWVVSDGTIQRVDVPIDPNDPEWKAIFLAQCTQNTDVASNILERTDARWIAFRKRMLRYQDHMTKPVKTGTSKGEVATDEQ